MPSAADCRQYGDDDEEEIVKRRALTHIHTDTERRRFVIVTASTPAKLVASLCCRGKITRSDLRETRVQTHASYQSGSVVAVGKFRLLRLDDRTKKGNPIS